MQVSIYRYNPDVDEVPAMRDMHVDLPDGKDLMVLDVLELLKTGDTSDIGPLLLELENNLLQPLLGALERERKRLYLRAGYDFDFELGLRAALKFWRRSSSLEDWLGRNQEF